MCINVVVPALVRARDHDYLAKPVVIVIIYLATIWFGVPSFAQAPAFVVQDLIFDNSSLKPNAIVPVDLDRDGDIDIVAGLQQSNGDNTLE
jgi:hypothetical protein